MAKEVRFDRNPLRSPRVDERTGRTRFDGVFTRAGIFTYRNTDGTERRELRLPEDVRESLPSLEMLPVIENHPPTADGLIDPREAARPPGVTLEGTRFDETDETVVGSILITDPDLLGTVRHRKNALSVGYTVDYDPTPGTHPKYGKYHGIQRNIRGDHLAIVEAGRAGPEARIRVDGAPDTRYEIQAHANSMPASLTSGETPHTLRYQMDEIEKLREQLKAATVRADSADARAEQATKRAEAADGKAESLKAELDKLKATRSDAEIVAQRDGEIKVLKLRVDGLEAELKTAKDPKRFRDAVLRRTSFEMRGRAVLGEKFRADMTDREIMAAVLEKTQGNTFADKTDENVEARFDIACENYVSTERALDKLKTETVVVRADRSVDTRTEREKMIARKRGEKVD
jgi:hypothetical protein